MKKREPTPIKTAAPKKPKVEIPAPLFKNLIAYLFSDFVNRGFLKKLDIFFKMIDTKPFVEDPDFEVMYVVLKNYLRLSLDDGIHRTEVLYSKIGTIEKHRVEIEDLICDISDVTLDESLALFIENEFLSRLNFIKAVPIIASLKRKISSFEKNEFENFSDIIDEIKEETLAFNKEMSARSASIVSFPEISFHGKDFMDIIEATHRELTNEKRFVRTGIKRLNNILGGGFQPGRIYVLLATSGGWKSGMLLNAILWASKYNRGMRCRDQAKKPLYLYLSQENDNTETMDRLYSYVGSAKDNKYESPAQILQRLKDDGTWNDDCEVKMVYRPKGMMCSIDIENVVREIEAEGEYEVKMIVHDYLKRLKANAPTGDIRIDLGEATNDLSILAKHLKIPIVTANQINREAYKTLMQEGKNATKNDLGKQASLTMQSESQMITENADIVLALNKECQALTEKWFIGITDLKNRGAKSNSSAKNRYFAIPFEDNNSMRLKEDVLLPDGQEYAINEIGDLLNKFDPEAGPNDDDMVGDSDVYVKRRPRNGRQVKHVNIEDEIME